MALERATGSFGIGTGVVGTTVSVTGLSFQPKVVIFCWSGRTAAGQAEGSHRMGMGYMVSAADRGGATSASLHASTITDARNQTFADACIKILAASGGGGAVDGAADFDAFLSDGFRVIIDDQFTASFLVSYLALGGADLTDVASVTVTTPTAPGTQDVTTVGFQPDAAIALGTEPGPSRSGWCVGVAAGATLVNALLVGVSGNGDPTSDTKSYCRAGEFFGVSPNAAATDMNVRGQLTDWLTNGFRLNWIDTFGALTVDFRVLCLKGPKFAVGDILSATNLTPFSDGVGFQPKALILGSHNKAQSTADVAQLTDERSVGFAVDAANRSAVDILDKNAAATSDVGVAHRLDECYVNLVSMDSDGFTVVMDDADPAAAFVWYLAMGDGPPPPPPAAGDGVSAQPKRSTYGMTWAIVKKRKTIIL